MDPAAALQAARARGLRALVLAEHVDFDPADQGYGYYDAEAVKKTFAEFRIPNSEFRIFRGVEITYQPQYQDAIREFVRAGRFDWVIGSVHLVGPDDISRPEQRERYFTARDQRRAYGDYLGEVEKLVASGLFDCLGHLDLCKRYGHAYYGPMDRALFAPQVTRILRGVVEKGMYIELNTSGLRQDPGEPYPSLGVVREYLALGGDRLVLGSDAHAPEHVGYAFPEMLAAIRSPWSSS
jgi:histidinol-phosphatase (PHP family)